MRRIIERKVTVVTTTTWTISWQDGPPQPHPEDASPQETISNAEPLPAAPNIPSSSSDIEIKEADPKSQGPSPEPNPPSNQ